MDKKSPKKVENTVGKGEIARYEQFLLFPQCFQKTCTAYTQKPGLVWERVKRVNSVCQHFIDARLIILQYFFHFLKILRENTCYVYSILFPIVPSIVFLEAIKTINTVQVKSKQYFVQSVKWYITYYYTAKKFLVI
jgi:hypothetical protein